MRGLKKSHGEGTNTYTDKQTSQLLERISLRADLLIIILWFFPKFWTNLMSVVEEKLGADAVVLGNFTT